MAPVNHSPIFDRLVLLLHSTLFILHSTFAFSAITPRQWDGINTFAYFDTPLVPDVVEFHKQFLPGAGLVPRRSAEIRQ